MIYTKYVLDYLAFKPGGKWTVDELRSTLPDGLGGAYALIMTMITGALEREKDGGATLRLLTEKLLPVLVVSRVPLTLDQVAWACGCTFEGQCYGQPELGSETEAALRSQVKDLLEMICNLFPTRPCNGGLMVVQPYHKSVLDWFKCEEGMDSRRFRVDEAQGHVLLGRAGEAYLRTHPDVRLTGGVPLVLDLVLPPPGNTYATRHTMAHICLAAGADEEPSEGDSLEKRGCAGQGIKSSTGVKSLASGGETACEARNRLLFNLGFWEVRVAVKEAKK